MESKGPEKDKETKETKETKEKKPRCYQCRKKMPLFSFTCKCKRIFCVIHQSPHSHGCIYDYQTEIQDKIRMTNPKVGPSTLVNPI